MDGQSPIELIQREMAVSAGIVGDSLDGTFVERGKHLLNADAFLLREPRFAYLYRRGQGVTLERDAGSAAAQEHLHLHGSVYAAVACINGFLPIHASAVAVDGRVVAFTAAAGSGKSTLVAGLTRLGLPLFCDDTLVLLPAEDGAVQCLPGHKRMKLWPDSVELTQSVALEQVSEDYPKFYVTPAGGDVGQILPLAALVFLEEGPHPQIVAVDGGEKIARLSDDHYTRALFDRVNPHSRQERFALQAGIARRMKMFTFVRSLDRTKFWDNTRYLADSLFTMVSA